MTDTVIYGSFVRLGPLYSSLGIHNTTAICHRTFENFILLYVLMRNHEIR